MTNSKTPLKVLLVDDQNLYAESLRDSLTNYAEDINVAGIASNGKEAVAMVKKQRPDVILMDIRMPEMDGVEAVKQLTKMYPEIKIIMLTTYKEDNLVHSALQAGASGYLLKDISTTELIAAIRALASGVMQISPEIVFQLVQQRFNAPLISKKPQGETRAPPAGPEETAEVPFEWLHDLTRREREIFTLLATGYDNEQIASRFDLAFQTVRNQVSTIYSKLGVKDRFEIIRLANKSRD